MFAQLASIASRPLGIAAIVATWLVVPLVVFALAPSLGEVTSSDNNDFLPGGAEAVQALELAEEKFPSGGSTPAIVVVHGDAGLTELDLASVALIGDTLRSDDAPEPISSVLTPFDGPQAASLISEDGRTMTLLVSLSGNQGEEEFEQTVDWIRETAAASVEGTGLQVAVTGPAGIIVDAVKVFSTIDFRVTLFTVVLVLLLLLVIYRSPVLALLPLLTIGWALFLAQSIAALLADSFGLSLNGQVTAIMSVLVFGAGTDFTLFIVSRYREELLRQPDRWAAMRETMTRIGPAISSSAATTIVAMLALLLAKDGSLNALGPMLAMAVFVVLVAGLTLIPALAVVMGRIAFWPTDPFRAKAPDAGRRGLWTVVAGSVARRPGLFLVATIVLLAVMSLGIPTIKPSYNFLEGLPADTDSRVGFELLQKSFPPGELAPTEVYISLPEGSIEPRLGAVQDLSAALSELPQVASVSGPGPRSISPDGTTFRMNLVLASDPYGTDAINAIDDVRQVARDSLSTGELADALVLVGGETAISADARSTLNRDIIVVAPIVLVAIWIILALLVRSIVAPTYLLASVLLSFAAALGLSVLIFQNVLGHSGVSYSNSVFMFIFLVALGSDYNIYIISRVREEAAHRGLVEGTRYAVSQTGAVITSAGIILAGTFSVLTTLPLRDIFQLGFAVMLGVLIDTFIVRGLLVPSIVLLLKDLNWWPSRGAKSPGSKGSRIPDNAPLDRTAGNAGE